MRTAIILLSAALYTDVCFGYIRLGYVEQGGAFVPLTRTDATGIQPYANDQIKAGLVSTATGTPLNVVSNGSDPVSAIRAAMKTWNAVPDTRLKFLALRGTPAEHNSSDYQMTIAFASADDLSLLGYAPGKSTGAIAITTNAWSVDKGKLGNGTAVDKGSILDSDILLNPSLTFSTDKSTPYDIQAVMTHEFGHALGANHSALLGATMFPFSAIGKQAAISQRLLSSDDLAFATVAFGVNSAAMGTASGRVVKPDGSPVKSALLTLIDRERGNTLGAITGPDGTWSQMLAPGTYIIYAEPFNNVVGASNIISLDLSQVTSGFQTTILGGPSSPAEIKVAAGATTAGLDITVSPATGALTAPFFGTGASGGHGDILTVNTPSGPSIMQSGTSFDIGIVSGGVDATTQILLLGQGITVRPGSTRVDTAVTFKDSKGLSLGPLLRASVDVAPHQTPTLATLMVVKGANIVTSSGLFVIVPPKPTFISKGVVSAASFNGANGDGAVSPGGLYSIFDLPGAPNLGPVDFAQPNGYDEYGLVPTTLSGVSVLFDGIPGPMFLSWNAQLNVQVPFEIDGRQTTAVQVSHNGSLSDPVPVPVVPSQPGFFTYTPGGTDSIAANQDYSFNTVQNPESRGKVVTLYGTGIGKAPYEVATGQGAPAPPSGYTGKASCTLNDSKAVSVAFNGWTPTAVGLAQWSLVLPQDSPTGVVKITCTDSNGAVTPAGTLYIK